MAILHPESMLKTNFVIEQLNLNGFLVYFFWPIILCLVTSFVTARYEERRVRRRFKCTFEETNSYRYRLVHLFAITFWFAVLSAVSMSVFEDPRLLVLFLVYVVSQVAAIFLIERLQTLKSVNEMSFQADDVKAE